MKNPFKYKAFLMYDQISMHYHQIRWARILLILGTIQSSFLLLGFWGGYVTKTTLISIHQDGLYAIPTSNDPFEETKMKDYLLELKVKFPNVAIAQSKIETGNYESSIFKESYNLFGMKEPNVRPTTAIGTMRNHAIYKDWRSSCIDYALWQARFCSKISTEDEYIVYLGSVYAEDRQYEIKLRRLLNKN